MYSVKTRISVLGQWYSKGQNKKIFKWIYFKTAIKVIRKLSFFFQMEIKPHSYPYGT